MSLESRIFSVLYFTQKNYNYFLNFEHVDVCCIFVLQISDKHGVLVSTHLWVPVTCCRHMTKPSHAMFLPALCQCNLRAFFPTASAAWAGCMPTMKQKTYASVSSLSLSLPLSLFLSLSHSLTWSLFLPPPFECFVWCFRLKKKCCVISCRQTCVLPRNSWECACQDDQLWPVEKCFRPFPGSSLIDMLGHPAARLTAGKRCFKSLECNDHKCRPNEMEGRSVIERRC